MVRVLQVTIFSSIEILAQWYPILHHVTQRCIVHLLPVRSFSANAVEFPQMRTYLIQNEGTLGDLFHNFICVVVTV